MQAKNDNWKDKNHVFRNSYLAQLSIETPAWNLDTERIQKLAKKFPIAIRSATDGVEVVIDDERLDATIFANRQHHWKNLDFAFRRHFCRTHVTALRLEHRLHGVMMIVGSTFRSYITILTWKHAAVKMAMSDTGRHNDVTPVLRDVCIHYLADNPITTAHNNGLIYIAPFMRYTLRVLNLRPPANMSEMHRSICRLNKLS